MRRRPRGRVKFRRAHRPGIASLLAALAAGLWFGPVHGQSLGSCGAGFVIPQRPAIEGALQAGEVAISADEANLDQDGESLLSGNVQVRRGNLQLAANNLTYNRENETAVASGKLRVWDEGLFLSGNNARLDLGAERTEVDEVEYRLESSFAHGEASKLTVQADRSLVVDEASYSTCDPRDPAWVLHADEIELDRVNEVGAAYNVWVELASIPVFYSPFVTFPLGDKRKSGLLPPSARISSSTGLEYTQPYYFNIAPDRDATLALRGMTNRGVQVQGEYRYLKTWGEGKLAAEFLPSDQEFGSSRTALNFRHVGDLDEAKRWHSDVDVGWVSDNDYLEDLGTNLGISSQRHLERRADLWYRGSGWWARGRLQDYQTLDDTIDVTDRPYERLPQLLVSTNLRERNRRLNFGGTAEVVHFNRSNGVTGTRFSIDPAVTFPIRGAGAYVVPRAGLRYSQYSLDDHTLGQDDSPSRLLPVFSVDSGLIFERKLALAQRRFTHTLEPRLHYLMVPFDRQDHIPIFDSGRSTLNYAQLFRNDRFNGGDRVGDTHQVTIGLTSRLLTPSGDESLRASVGQIRYLRDRKVTLPGRTRETEDASDIVAELALNLDRRWRLLGGWHWNPDREQTDKQAISVRYQPEERKVINVGYRFLREQSFIDEPSVEQTDISVGWPINHALSFVGRWNYALDARTTLESFAGLEYESCCWAMRAVFRRHLSGEDGDHVNGFFLQLELKGLAGVGGRTVDFLERHIPGYQNRF